MTSAGTPTYDISRHAHLWQALELGISMEQAQLVHQGGKANTGIKLAQTTTVHGLEPGVQA